MKFPSGVLRFAVGCALFGAVFTAAGFLMGGRLTAVHVYWDNGPRVRYEEWDGQSRAPEVSASEAAPQAGTGPVGEETVVEDKGRHGGAVPTGDVRRLEVNAGACEVTVTVGDDWGVWYDGDLRVTSDFDDDGEWEIETPAVKNLAMGDMGSLTIQVPRDTVLAELDLTIGAGKLYAEGLVCEEGNFSVGAGTMTLENVSCLSESDWETGAGALCVRGGQLRGEVSIECGMGSVEMDIDRPKSYDYSVDCGMGSVTVDGSKYAGIAAERNFTGRSADALFEIDCGMGSVEIRFTD